MAGSTPLSKQNHRCIGKIQQCQLDAIPRLNQPVRQTGKLARKWCLQILATVLGLHPAADSTLSSRGVPLASQAMWGEVEEVRHLSKWHLAQIFFQ
jgi:hypothetical protein